MPRMGMTFKIRNFLILMFAFGVTSLILICTFGRDQQDIQQLFTQTHKHFESFKENLKGSSNEKKLEVDEKYLNLLGFNKDLTLNNNVIVKNSTLPFYIVSAVAKNELTHAEQFLNNVHSISPNYQVVLWNLDSKTPIYEDNDFSQSLKQICNNSCSVERFSFEEFPDHVKDLSLRAYRPLVIQTMLMRGGCIFFMDIDRRFLPNAKETLEKILELKESRDEGIIGWSNGRPTSSLTHPKVYQFFHTDPENYYFLRMINPSQLFVCNTPLVHSRVMHPWILCVLNFDCISPFGAQPGGCRFDKKPLYRYSGCHHYDSSALNVALGIAFGVVSQPYVSRVQISRPAQTSTFNNGTYS